ncbi:MAG: hypothetical protein E2O89_07095 [Alphaproteobacteria bacterium]|nr:MAG: hypothetical protein E2O89_07095 [Alphaproteobacteria bacterium]
MPLPNLIAGGLFSLGEEIIKRVWPDPSQQQEALLELKKLEQQGELAQLAVNFQEAQHESLLVAGWRPFVGWVCGLAFAYTFILQPFMSFFAVLAGADLTNLPELDIGTMIPVLMGMLGLGWLRTQEKKDGVNKNR